MYVSVVRSKFVIWSNWFSGPSCSLVESWRSLSYKGMENVLPLYKLNMLP